jgi:hypothetical protein
MPHSKKKKIERKKEKEQSRSSHVPVFLEEVVESTGLVWGCGQ